MCIRDRPETAHPAFAKAAHLFGMGLTVVPVDPVTTLVDPSAMAAAIDDDTAVIIGSAGNYPYGTIDPITELGALALDRGVGLHVDGCLGGFVLPFGEELGYAVPPFDFRVPGVTSISADTHKYGYGLKGTSTLLFRDKALRNRAYFFVPDWSGAVSYTHLDVYKRQVRGEPAGRLVEVHGRHGGRPPCVGGTVPVCRAAAPSPPRWRRGQRPGGTAYRQVCRLALRTHSFGLIWLSIAAWVSLSSAAKTVSYTHLDVYKRQHDR